MQRYNELRPCVWGAQGSCVWGAQGSCAGCVGCRGQLCRMCEVEMAAVQDVLREVQRAAVQDVLCEEQRDCGDCVCRGEGTGCVTHVRFNAYLILIYIFWQLSIITICIPFINI